MKFAIFAKNLNIMESQVRQRYPIGKQDFAKIRGEGYLYVDKTDLVYRLTHMDSSYVFLSRPRRFGKSLLVSTLKAYFEGKKDLFKGLAIEKLEKEWIEYPVLYFDMSEGKHMEKDALERYLANIITTQEELLEMPITEGDANIRLSNLIRRLYMKTGKQVVVLIDEYDAPLLDVVNEKKNLPILRNIMRNFYSPLKGSDQYIKFVFLTGITKFSQLSIFSELNNIKNISMFEDYAAICGITQDEMLVQLKSGIENFAQKKGYSYRQAVDELKSQYDGYHFCWSSPDIYNPYSLLNALSDRMMSSYWFESGTPIFLVDTLRTLNVDAVDITGKYYNADSFDVPTESLEDATPLLYQVGYLTIKGYMDDPIKYLLDFPNKEVRVGLMKSLLSSYVTPMKKKACLDMVDNLYINIRDGKIDEALKELQTFLKGVSFQNQEYNEAHYKSMIFAILTLVGNHPFNELRNSDDQIDMTIFTKKAIYIFEFKLGKSANAAMEQINEKGYAIGFEIYKLPIIKVGVNIDPKTRTLEDGWLIKEHKY